MTTMFARPTPVLVAAGKAEDKMAVVGVSSPAVTVLMRDNAQEFSSHSATVTFSIGSSSLPHRFQVI